MDAVTAARLVTILLAPSAVAAGVLWLPRAVRAVHGRLIGHERAAPTGPPLERTAADLRRLLAEHDRVRRSADVAVRAARLRALEGALTDCAVDAARALGVDLPPRTGRAPLGPEQLRAALGRLADAGMVLPPAERFGR